MVFAVLTSTVPTSQIQQHHKLSSSYKVG